jgi:hypothetical protein
MRYCRQIDVYKMALRGLARKKIAESFHTSWNEVKLANIRLQRALFLPLYSELSPRGWLCCGMGQRGESVASPGQK